MATKNGWNDYQKLVLNELSRLDSNQQKLMIKLDRLSVDIAMLQVKAGVWGALGSLIIVVPAFIAAIMRE